MGLQHQYRKLMGHLLISLGKIKGFYENWIFQDHKFDEDYSKYRHQMLKRHGGDLATPTDITPIIA
ncbi:MAG: hypothetical protein AABX08_00635 [Nanoarchaeota archaeon]